MSDKTTEQKIDEIHDNVLMLTMNFTAFKESCSVQHKMLNKTMDGYDKDLYGNGKPGIIERFNNLENRLIIWCSVAIVLAQIFGPKVLKLLNLV